MPRNGSGAYVAPAGQPVVSGTAISSTVFNALVTDLGNELTKSICTDGQTPMTANLPMGNNRITGMAAGVSAGDATRLDQVQTIAGAYLPLAGGTMTGSVTFANTVTINNNTTFFVKDSGGTARQLFNFAADNTLNWTVPGGSSWNIYSQAGVGPIWSISNTGIVSQKAGLLLDNGIQIQSKDGGGVTRDLLYMAGNTVVQRVAGGTSIQWYSQSAALIATLTNAGDFSAVTVTQTSDATKKRDWKLLTDGQLESLGKVTSGTFEWIESGARSVGGSAQEIQSIVPEAVHVSETGELSVNYGGLNFAILQAMLRRQKAAV